MIQAYGGVTFDFRLSNPKDIFAVVYAGNAQTLWTDSANVYQYVRQVNTTGARELQEGWTSSHSFTRGFSFKYDTLNQFYLGNTPTGAKGDSVMVKHGDMVQAVSPALPIQYQHTLFTPTTGGTVSLVNNQYNIINPAGALVAVTLNLPSSPSNNDVVYIKFTQTVSTVTYANGTVVDGITAPTAGGLVVLTYDSGSTSWY